MFTNIILYTKSVPFSNPIYFCTSIVTQLIIRSPSAGIDNLIGCNPTPNYTFGRGLQFLQ